LGWGIFNFVEGLVDHEVLGVHHVNELVAPSQRVYWDIAFLIWGLVMIVVGWCLLKSGKQETAYADRRA
jgi:uncharacterized membrane protein